MQIYGYYILNIHGTQVHVFETVFVGGRVKQIFART